MVTCTCPLSSKESQMCESQGNKENAKKIKEDNTGHIKKGYVAHARIHLPLLHSRTNEYTAAATTGTERLATSPAYLACVCVCSRSCLLLQNDKRGTREGRRRWVEQKKKSEEREAERGSTRDVWQAHTDVLLVSASIDTHTHTHINTYTHRLDFFFLSSSCWWWSLITCHLVSSFHFLPLIFYQSRVHRRAHRHTCTHAHMHKKRSWDRPAAAAASHSIHHAMFHLCLHCFFFLSQIYMLPLIGNIPYPSSSFFFKGCKKKKKLIERSKKITTGGNKRKRQ